MSAKEPVSPAIALAHARAAKARVVALVGDHPAVNGIGIVAEEDGYAVKVNLTAPQQAGLDLPARVGPVPVRVDVVGPIVAR